MFGQKTELEADAELFTVFDSKGAYYRDPVLHMNKLDAIRAIETLFKDPRHSNNLLVSNAEDFSLFKIGSYYRKTGRVVPCNPEHVVNFHDLRTAEMLKKPNEAVAAL